jgi:tryptophanyl-tRNA synthetase
MPGLKSRPTFSTTDLCGYILLPFLIETKMSEETKITAHKRVLSGMRPTGKLHLGNYMGALKNWVDLQNATNEDGTQTYECYFFIADYHALTTDYADTNQLRENVREVALDFLAAGLDRKKCTIFLQSEVQAHFVLNSLLEMITPLSWLERVPTYKDQQEQLKEKDLATIGFLGYPVLQSADILVYQADLVPVGQDQAAHVEITREIARRFNHLYGNKPAAHATSGHISDKERLAELEQAKDVREILPEPKVLLTPSPKLPGTDGRKMSKSYGNTILLSEPEADVRAKLKTMVTDPARVRRTDPGNPDVCPVFDLHKVFSSEEVQAQAAEGCRSAGIGCIQCKGWLADGVVAELKPIQDRRRYYEANPDEVDAILDEGAFRANGRTMVTMRQVFTAVGLSRR